MTLFVAWEIPNLFPQSEPAQISSINLSSLLFEKLYIISLKSAKLLYIVSDRCIVILYCMFLFYCFNVLMVYNPALSCYMQ